MRGIAHHIHPRPDNRLGKHPRSRMNVVDDFSFDDSESVVWHLDHSQDCD
jgi:hypothetical protein